MGKIKRMTLLGLLFGLAVLLVVAPNDIKLKSGLRFVFLHGAITWVSFVIFAVFAVAAVAFLITGRETLYNLASRGVKVGTLFWVANAMVWAPLSWFAWNTIFGEPRSVYFVKVMLVLGIVYLASEFIQSTKIKAGIYALLGAGIWGYGITVMGIYSGVNRMLHPLDPIGESNSPTIKIIYQLIQLSVFLIGILLVLPEKNRE